VGRRSGLFPQELEQEGLVLVEVGLVLEAWEALVQAVELVHQTQLGTTAENECRTHFHWC